MALVSVAVGADSDRDLLDRLLRREEEALRACIALHGPSVYGMARRVLADPTLAEEVAQDTFVALWRRPGMFDPDRGSLQAFLVGIARNKAVDMVRREESRRRTRERLLKETESSLGGRDEISDSERRQDVLDALAGLSEQQREALVLAYYGGRTYREVALELGILEGTAKTRLRDGLAKLRERLGTSAGGTDAV